MPYISNTSDYERTDGELEYEGTHYNYVKRKVSNDTLYVMCLPNISKTQLYNAKTAYSKEVNDIPVNKKAAESSKKAGFDTEYNRAQNFYTDVNTDIAFAIKYPSAKTTRLNPIYIDIPEQPPKPAC